MTIKKGEFKGYHLAIIMVCFFGVIICVNFFMAYLANSNWTGLVVKNSYVASQNFNTGLQAAKRQKQMGWRSEFSYEQDTLRLVLHDVNGTPLSTANISAKIGRPAFEQMDHEVTLSARGQGVFMAQDKLQPGLWKITLAANIAGEPYRRDLRLFVSDNGQGVLQ